MTSFARALMNNVIGSVQYTTNGANTVTHSNASFARAIVRVHLYVISLLASYSILILKIIL
jgi:hypothetical protein